MNWKLVIDTFLEAYHVPHLHERTLAPTILGSPAVWDAFGQGSRLSPCAARSPRRASVRSREWNLLEHAVVLYQLFPNTMLIYQIDHVEIVQAYPDPTSADASTVVFALYTPAVVGSDRARRHFQSNFDLLLNVTEDEDFRLGVQIQRGFHVAGHDSIVFGRNEPGLAHYHRMIKAALTERD